MPKKTPIVGADGTPLNKKAWKCQRSLREANEWRLWAEDTIDKFMEEYKQLSQLKGVPQEDVENMAVVRAQFIELKKAFKPLEKALSKATGQRLRKARKVS